MTWKEKIQRSLHRPESEKPLLRGADVRWCGHFHFLAPGTISGQIDGHLVSGHALHILADCELTGDCQAKSLVIEGKMRGTCRITEEAQLAAGSQLEGDLSAASLLIDSNSTFTGALRIGQPTQ